MMAAFVVLGVRCLRTPGFVPLFLSETRLQQVRKKNAVHLHAELGALKLRQQHLHSVLFYPSPPVSSSLFVTFYIFTLFLYKMFPSRRVSFLIATL